MKKLEELERQIVDARQMKIYAAIAFVCAAAFLIFRLLAQ